jgi:hypothetical protein
LGVEMREKVRGREGGGEVGGELTPCDPCGANCGASGISGEGGVFDGVTNADDGDAMDRVGEKCTGTNFLGEGRGACDLDVGNAFMDANDDDVDVDVDVDVDDDDDEKISGDDRPGGRLVCLIMGVVGDRCVGV